MKEALCHICGETIESMLGMDKPPDDASLVVNGQWMWVPELADSVFVLDPDGEMTVVQLVNGQMALRPEGESYKHAHKECQEALVHEDSGIGLLDWED